MPQFTAGGVCESKSGNHVAVRKLAGLSGVEKLVLGWWVVIACLAFPAVTTGFAPLIAVAGLLMIGLGLFVATNYGGVATRLGNRRVGFGPFWQQQSPAYWRFSGVVLVIIGAGWTVAIGQVL